MGEEADFLRTLVPVGFRMSTPARRNVRQPSHTRARRQPQLWSGPNFPGMTRIFAHRVFLLVLL